jgi:diadenosine tetraphosphate (Ap4A) HIT family hydrolase
MVKVKSFEGEKKNIKCIGCALQKGIIKNSSGLIFKGKHFEVRQDYELPIKGFFIIFSKRHIVGFADFKKTEQKEFIELLCKLRKIMRDKLNIEFIEIFMREITIKSKKAPSHFHMGLLPRYPWMKKFKDTREIFKYAKKKMKTKKNLKEINNVAEIVKNEIL